MQSFPLKFRIHVLFFFVLILLYSCSKKLNFSASNLVPAAQGNVSYKKDNNGNYSINVKIMHLASPSRLSPPKNSYVVWMKTEQNNYRNLGQINSSSGLFSKTLKGSLHAVTAYKPESFIITAEDNPNISYPGNMVVLKTE